MADWKGVHYNDNDMLHMQQEALRRVRQMQKRAERNVEGNPADNLSFSEEPMQFTQPAQSAHSATPHQPRMPPPQQMHHNPTAHQAAQPPESLFSQLGEAFGLGGLGEKLGLGGQGNTGESKGNFISSLLGADSPAARVLDALHIDNERLLLIGLLLVLLNEKGDRTLLIALVYLLL